MTEPRQFDPLAGFLALKEQLCSEDFEFVSRMFREHPERAAELMMERGGEEVTSEEFAQFSFEIANRIAREAAS